MVDFHLIDLPLEGYPYTWSKSLRTPDRVKERLDRALSSGNWLDLFPNVVLFNLIANFGP